MKKYSSRKSKSLNNDVDIIFTFNYVCINIYTNYEVYDNNDLDEMINILATLTREICIDKSYVDYPGTKYCHTFIEYNVWKYVCKLVYESKFGKNLTYKKCRQLIEIEQEMILCYLYGCFAQLGYDIEYIHLEFDPDNQFKFMTKYELDTIRSWNDYSTNPYI